MPDRQVDPTTETAEEWLAERGYQRFEGPYRHLPFWQSSSWWLAAVWFGCCVAALVVLGVTQC